MIVFKSTTSAHRVFSKMTKAFVVIAVFFLGVLFALLWESSAHAQDCGRHKCDGPTQNGRMEYSVSEGTYLFVPNTPEQAEAACAQLKADSTNRMCVWDSGVGTYKYVPLPQPQGVSPDVQARHPESREPRVNRGHRTFGPR